MLTITHTSRITRKSHHKECDLMLYAHPKYIFQNLPLTTNLFIDLYMHIRRCSLLTIIY